MWVLLTNDIEVLTRSTKREVVRPSDVQVVHAGVPSEGGGETSGTPESREPKLVRIDGSEEFSHLFGYYLRIPNSAAIAYGDVIQQCDCKSDCASPQNLTDRRHTC